MSVKIGKERQRAEMGLYFHIPFCPHLCPYCDFVKTDRFKKNDVQAFFARLQRQLSEFLSTWTSSSTPRPVVTVYFGGGTPGLFDGSFYAPILNQVRTVFEIEECTLETNPGFVPLGRIAGWKQAGFNRVTLGVQSLNSHVLHFLGRKHTPEQVQQVIRALIGEGFENIQADLIYGLPAGGKGARPFERQIESEINRLTDMGISGLSAYALTVEPGTEFGALGVTPSDDRAADEYGIIQQLAAQHGFVQRETSNFSRFECKHNNIYWYGLPYMGFGVGAHGLTGPEDGHPYGRRYRVGLRSSSPEDGVRKQSAPGRDTFDFETADSEDFRVVFEGLRTSEDYTVEMLFTLLRTPEGVPGEWLSAHFGADFVTKIPPGFVVSNKGSVSLPPHQLLLGDRWHKVLVDALLVNCT